ncbi:hypothetical protein LNP74_21250 [Klebsiella pneumoniae subsp. pneumoniae]|nr:hypothetical protein [Klebsiella pneumoniae subsp. pneumoniae]
MATTRKTLPAGAPANGHYKAYILGEGDDGIAKTPQWALAYYRYPHRSHH